MKDKDGFLIKCIHSDWKVVDERGNKDFVCCNEHMRTNHECYADEYCRYYESEVRNEHL